MLFIKRLRKLLMKFLHVINPFLFLTFTILISCFSLSAAAIVRTDVVFYDLATANQRSYRLDMLPTPGGAHATLQRDDSAFALSTDIATCLNTQPSADPKGYLRLKARDTQHADPALAPFMNFTQNNRLRVTMKPLPNAQYLLLDRDSLTVVVVDPTMMTISTAGCQR